MAAKTAAQKSFDRLVRLARKLKLEDVTSDKTSHGTPTLRVHDTPFVHIKAAGVMVLHCPLDAKELLIEMAPDIYYQTPHYEGWPALLVRLDLIGDEELALRIENAWRFKAPKRLAAKRPTAG